MRDVRRAIPWALALVSGAYPARAGAPQPQYVVQYDLRGLSAEITVNDAPVDDYFGPLSVTHGGGGVNMWLRPGKNRLRVHGKAAAGGGPPKAEVSVWVEDESRGSARKTVASLTWPPPGAPTTSIDETITFQADPAPPSTLWSRAQPITLDDAARAAIIKVATDLHRAFATKDIKKVMAMTEERDAEMARCFYQPIEATRKDRRDDLKERIRGIWKPAPIHPEQIELTPIEDRLLVAVTSKGQPVIHIGMGAAAFVLPIYVAHVDGQWVIAR